MPGGIALAGGDEFRPGCEIMDASLLEMSAPKAPSVLVIPTAAHDAPAKAAANGVRHFTRLGAQASELMVLDSDDANDEGLAGRIGGSTHVYFTGGSPQRLLTVLRGSLLLRRLREWLAQGGIVAGSSAGAMVMGSFLRLPRDGSWRAALDLCPGIAVLPHHEGSDPTAVSKGLAETAPKGVRILGIDARTCCVESPGGWRVVGVGRAVLYFNGEWRSYGHGEIIPRQGPPGVGY